MAFNRHMVGSNGKNVVIQRGPFGPISYDEALEFAAWIVAVTDDYNGQKFLEKLREVQGS